jgi:hypothetical protein
VSALGLLSAPDEMILDLARIEDRVVITACGSEGLPFPGGKTLFRGPFGVVGTGVDPVTSRFSAARSTS